MCVCYAKRSIGNDLSKEEHEHILRFVAGAVICRA